MYSVIYFSQVDDGENYENIQFFFSLNTQSGHPPFWEQFCNILSSPVLKGACHKEGNGSHSKYLTTNCLNVTCEISSQ